MKEDCRVHYLLAWQDIPEKISFVLSFNNGSDGSVLYPEYWVSPPEYVEISEEENEKQTKHNKTKDQH